MSSQQDFNDNEIPRGPQVGDVVLPYRLLRLLGEGSAGRVFEVEHIKIGRRAAMKVLMPDHANRPGAIRRLFQEARAVNRINHPHIVDVTDLIEARAPNEVNAIVMELLEGQSLAQAMLAEPQMPPARIIKIVSQVADALAAAHGAYFIHRDLKPENIFLVRRGINEDVVKVLDFGLAKSFASKDAKSSHNSYHTVEGTFVGTPAYTSPEQASAKALDHRTDIYSLGVILYELLAGRLPFEGRNFGEFLVKHLTLAVPRIPSARLSTPVERTLALVAYKCLEKNPAERFGSAADIKDVLERLARGEVVDVRVRGAAKGVVESRPNRRAQVLAAVAALVMGGALAVAFSRPNAAAPVPSRAQAESGSVVFTFASDPPGAEVRLAGTTGLLGLTPFQQEFPRDGRWLAFVMRKPGYSEEPFSVTTAQDVTVNRRLSLLPPPPVATLAPANGSAGGAGGKPRSRKEAAAARAGRHSYTLDPFAP